MHCPACSPPHRRPHWPTSPSKSWRLFASTSISGAGGLVDVPLCIQHAAYVSSMLPFDIAHVHAQTPGAPLSRMLPQLHGGLAPAMHLRFQYACGYSAGATPGALPYPVVSGTRAYREPHSLARLPAAFFSRGRGLHALAFYFFFRVSYFIFSFHCLSRPRRPAAQSLPRDESGNSNPAKPAQRALLPAFAGWPWPAAAAGCGCGRT
jgi:hypothetical protein